MAALAICFGTVLALSAEVFFERHEFLMPPAPGITRQYPIAFRIDGAMILKTGMFILLTSTVATALAATRVARMPIAEALRAS